MKILYVEDSVSAAIVMKRRLTSFGNEVLYAMNGREAVALFRTEEPDLVLMDIEMPVMNGFEASSHIRAFEATKQWAWTPIIFLTASDTMANLLTAIEAGGDDFIAKSVPEPILQAKMNAMSRIAGLRQRLTQANEKLEALASQDGLTGLCNRRSMDARLDAAHAEAVRREGALGLLMIDIDNFKKYNDHYGHLQGDDCLRRVAQSIQAVIEGMTTLSHFTGAFAARYGGEEFAVVLPGTSADMVGQTASALVEAVRNLAIPHEKNAEWGNVTISAGCAHLNPVCGSVADMFGTADAKLYAAKANGRNRWEFAQ